MTNVKTAFIGAINERLPEQDYQLLLEQHSALIPREFVQNHGIHMSLVLRKLSLAKDYTCDFFYLAKSSGDWNCVFVEIEKPWSQLFKPDNTLHRDLREGLDQISRWRAWFSNPSNFDGFVNGTIRWLRVPYLMRSNPCYMKYVLVIGRRAETEQNDVRRDLLRTHERDDFKIISYDSLVEALDVKPDLYVGVRHNEYVEVISDRYAGESLFSLLPPERLKISAALRDDVIANRNQWCEHDQIFPPKLTLDRLLPLVPLRG